MRWLPNILSTLRFFLAFTFPFIPPHYWISLVIIAGFTEWSDGYLARRYKVESKFGVMMDPIADKVFFLAVVLTLFWRDIIYVWQIALLSLREIAVLSGIFWVSLHRQWSEYTKMKPKWSGKVTTAVQYLFFLSVLMLRDIQVYLFYITVAVGTWSAIDYITWFIDDRRKTRISR